MKPVEQLANWVEQKHHGQVIKKTSKPYFTHLEAVAEMAGEATLLGYEIGLCHDLLEDTETSPAELRAALINFNYTANDADYITERVIELTDVFTAATYKGLSKGFRKEQEALRLRTISAGAQTVKYCDLIDNIKWVLKHDRKRAAAYLEKKNLLLAGMLKGDQAMHQKVLEAINNGLSRLKSISF